MKKSSRKWLYGLSILLAFILWMLWGNFTFAQSHYIITDEQLPESFQGYKIAHLSDLHNNFWENQLLDSVADFEPDIIAITGDLVNYSTESFGEMEDWLVQLKEIAPVYYVTGNHEAWNLQYKEFVEILERSEIIMLDNTNIIIEENNEEIMLLGLQDPAFLSESNLLGEHALVIESTIKSLTEGSNHYKIMLSHRPELFDVYANHELNFVLSGHAHGGQFRLPLIGGLVAPDQGFFPKYTSGVYEENGTKMLVSRGLGSSSIPVRFNNRPELIFIQLENE